MALTIFRSFLSTITPFRRGGILANLHILEDPTTGAPVGIQNERANGPDGIWTPIDVTAAQVASPNAIMLADLNATYRLNVAPYTRYRSDGARLLNLDPSAENEIPATGPFANVILYSPVTITDPAGLTVQGTARVQAFPA